MNIGTSSGSYAMSGFFGSAGFGTHSYQPQIGSLMSAVSSTTHFRPIEPIPDGASVRFRLNGAFYTGQIVSATQEGPAAQPLYVIQPDNALPLTGTRPIARYHEFVVRVSPLQRFTEAVWAPEPAVTFGVAPVAAPAPPVAETAAKTVKPKKRKAHARP